MVQYICGYEGTMTIRTTINPHTLCIAAVLIGISAHSSFGQSVSLASGQANPSSSAGLALSFTAGTTPAAAISWTLTYPAADISNVTVSAVPALTAAGKSVSCAAQSGGYKCVASGMNATPIGSGVLATVTAATSSSFAGATIGLSSEGASAAGDTLALSSTGGTLSVIAQVPLQPVLSSLTCGTLSFSAAGTSACTVTLSSAALTGGFGVTLSSNNTLVRVPAGVTVAAGATSAGFTATVSATNTAQTVVVSAAAAGVTKPVSFSLSNAATQVISSLVCSPNALAASGISTCVATLSASSPATTVQLGVTSSNSSVTVPSNVTIAAGQKSAQFGASAAANCMAGTAVITAKMLTGSAASSTLTITAESPKPAVTISVSPDSIAPGASATLSWTLSGATSATIDQGVGTVTSNGSKTVTPSATTTYTITASNTAGSSSNSTRLTVAATGQNYQVTFASYIGGNNWEHARDVTTDAAGNIYLVGGTESSNFNHTIGQSYAGSVDAFVMKMDPNGKLIWSTLLGGPNYDRAYAVEVDKSGNVYLTGRAGRGFPVKNAMQSTFSGYNTGSAYGEQNAFIAKLSSSGTVQWATYFGTGDLNRDMDIDSSGNVYVASNYQPALGQVAFPSAWFSKAFQKAPQGGNDLVVAKIAASGSNVLWATYLGGSGDDSHKATIRMAPTGDLYIFTDTASTNMPVPNGYQTTNRGGRDAYLAKMKNDGSALLWATYFGGSGLEVCETHHMAVDKWSNVYFAVTTQSTDAPVTKSDMTYNGTGATFSHAMGDVLVAKFSSSGGLIASTYVGGADGEGPQGVAVDDGGNVYFSGGTVSANFPVTQNAVQGSKKAGEDAIVVRLKSDFSGLDYVSFLGTSGNDEGRTLYADAAGNIYVAIEAGAGDFPLIKNPVQATFGGGSADILLVKLAPGTASDTQTEVLSSLVCSPTSLAPSGVSTCVATLSASSPAATVLNLSSNNALVAVPSNVTITAGQKSGQFGATAAVHCTAGTALITARMLTGTAASATLTTTAAVSKPGVTISVSPSTVIPGASATLSWTLSGAASATIDQGVGTVTANGSKTVAPSATTTYTISASNAAGSSSISTSLTVAALAAPGEDYQVSFASYIGGNNWEQTRDVTADAAGNIYMVGGTQSSNFSHTIGQAYAGSVDAFVMKMDPNGRLIWSTLLGGPNYDRADAVDVDKSGNVYLTGRAGRGFPVKNALQSAFSGYNTASALGEQDAFIAKLSATGAVQWATYFGTGDLNSDLEIDSSGNVYVVSDYQPALGQVAFPSAWFSNAFQKVPQGGKDLVIAKVASDGSKVLWGTYLGGSADDGTIGSIRIASSGDIYILTDTASSNMPVPNGYQKTNRGGRDAYLAKMKNDGSALAWATYFGGSGLELCETHHLAVDKWNNVYLAVTTQSTDAPVNKGDMTYNGTGTTVFHAIGDVLVAKFSSSGGLIASTYVGGADGDGPQGLALDANGNVYFSGGTASPNFPVTQNAVQGSKMAGEDATVVRLKADFSGLDYVSFLGTHGNDEGHTLYADAAGNIYVGIEAGAGDFPLIKNPVQTAFGGGTADILLVKLTPTT